MAPIIDDFNYDTEMNNETISPIHMNTLGLPDTAFYTMEAKRLRDECIADQLHRLIDRLKQLFNIRSTDVQKPIVNDHSVRA